MTNNNLLSSGSNYNSASQTIPPPYSSGEPSQATSQDIKYDDGVLLINFVKDRSGPDVMLLPTSDVSTIKDQLP